MRTTSAISFYCKESKTDRNGYAPIQLSIIVNGKRVFLNLPRKEKPRLFAKRKKDDDLSAYLELVRMRINEVQTELLLRGMPITAPALREYLKGGGIKTYTISDLFEEYMPLLEMRVGVSLTRRTYEKYILVRNEFLDFVGKDKEADKILPIDISKFYALLCTKKKPSTTAGEMTKLKTIFRYGFENGKISTLPFTGVKILKPVSEIVVLNAEEIRKINERDFGCDRLNKVRDLFAFQCFSGLSYADMKCLQPEDLKVHDDIYYINKKRVKTGTDFTAIVLPPGVKIFEKYGGRLPVMSNQCMNRYIHEIGALCGIDKEITDHTARKSYATFLLNSSMPLASVSKCLGHKEVAVTERYYAKKLDETLFLEAKKIMG